MKVLLFPALTGSIMALMLSVPVFAQPFPGYSNGPMYRFDNGAVGEITGAGGGSAQVRYYDGSALQTGDFPLDIDPTADPSDAAALARVLASAQHADAPLTDVATTPNLCFRNGQQTTHPGFERHCDITTLDFCVGLARPWRINAPCIDSVRDDGYMINIWLPEGSTAGRASCPIDTPDGAPDCTSRYVTQFFGAPTTTDLPFPDDAGYDDAFVEWIARCMGRTDGECGVLDPDIHRMPPTTSKWAHSTPTQVPPINFPQAAPGGASGQTMNPGGYFPGGVSGGGSLTDGSGSGSGPGGPGNGDGGTGDGGTGDGGNGDCDPLTEDCSGQGQGNCLDEQNCEFGFEVEGSDELGLDVVSVDIPLLDFADPGWLPEACPQPISTTIMGAQMQIMEFDQLCGVAGMIRAFVLMAGALVSMRIVFA